MAPSVNLNVPGQTGMRTYFGFIMTVIYCVTMVFVILFQLQGFFDSSSPLVTQQVIQEDTALKMDLAQSNLLPVVYIYFDGNVIAPSLSFTYVTLRYVKRKYLRTRDSSGAMTTQQTNTWMQVKPCSAIVNNPAAATPYQPYVDQQQFKRFAASYGHCVEYLPGETYIDKTEDDDKGQDTIEVTELVVFPCSLATGCITTGFPKIQIEIAIPSVSTNMNNYESPVSKLMTVEKYSQSVQLGQSQRTLHRLAANEIWDDQNVPWKKASRKFSYYSIDKSSYSVEERDKTQSVCTDATILDGSCEGFTTFEFQTTPRKY